MVHSSCPNRILLNISLKCLPSKIQYHEHLSSDTIVIRLPIVLARSICSLPAKTNTQMTNKLIYYTFDKSENISYDLGA